MHKFAEIWECSTASVSKYKGVLQDFYHHFVAMLTYKLSGVVQIDGTYVGGAAVKKKYLVFSVFFFSRQDSACVF